LLIVGIALYYLARPASGWISELPPNVRQMEYKLRDVLRPVAQMSEVAEQMDNLTTMDNGGPKKPEVTVEGVQLSDTMWSTFQSFAGYMVVVLILLFFMLAFGEHFFRRMDAEFSAGHMVRELGDSLSKYLLTITLINAGLGVAIGIAMFLWGMPTPVLWGLIGMFMNYIPFLGAIAGVALAGFVGLLTFDSTLPQLGVPLTYFLLTSIEGNFITPTILGQRFTLNPIIIFIAILFWGWIWGIPGALMAVPLLVGFKIVCEHFPPLQRIGRLMNA
ncbi:MAG: AI-2E family transporter, partial [Candidatus Hydrogenedentes bacterium]|nr:AI-2E family transporter [Candidatus Hydrogenedentota bacterium]